MSIIGDIEGYISGGRAGKSISDANVAAEHGVLNATQQGQAGVTGALGTANQILPAAGQQATQQVGEATTGANSTLQQLMAQINGTYSPYVQSGVQGSTGLQNYAASNPQFNFDPSKYINSDAYNFQLGQGQHAIENTASSRGLGQSGAALKELTQYGQGLASTYYNNAFNQAQSQFETNQNTTLQNLQALIQSGQFGASGTSNATQNLGGQQAANTLASGYYGGNTNLSIAQLLSQLGLQGAEYSGDLGLKGSTTAGNFAVGAGQANAGGILSQGNAIAGFGSDLGTILAGLVHP